MTVFYGDVVTEARRLVTPAVPYVLGAEVGLSNVVLRPGFVPKSLDCSEATQLTWWAAGVDAAPPDGVWQQCWWLERLRLRIPVAAALGLPGRVVARNFGPGGAGGAGNHIATTVGDGVHTIEARNRRAGCGIFDGRNRGWTHAYNLPGCVDFTPAPSPDPLPTPTLEDTMRLVRGDGPGRDPNPGATDEANVRGNGYALCALGADGLWWIGDGDAAATYRRVYGKETVVPQTELDAIRFAGRVA